MLITPELFAIILDLTDYELTIKLLQLNFELSQNAIIYSSLKNEHSLYLNAMRISKEPTLNLDGLFIKSCELNLIKKAKFLLENQADIHCYNYRVLRIMISNNNLRLAKLLIKKGADIHCFDDGPLRWSILDKNYTMIIFLLNNGARINDYDYDFYLENSLLNDFNKFSNLSDKIKKQK
jgi:hypothetical protein